ncbi:hypothetical protein [Streptomyces sp. NPDC020983]|uniref:hypothetical protein n=1 Tax=Streptomyces sp. NPDC020983 TaxID=3365106 RepID=UPI0037A07F10
MRTPGTICRGLVVAGALVLAAAGPGYAYTSPSKSTSGDSDGSGLLAAGVHITYPSGKHEEAGSRPMGSSNVTWSPPPCWIGPIGDPKTFKANILKQVADTNVPGQANYALEAMNELQRHYEEGYTWDGGGEGYKDFNLDKQGKGQFWGPISNPDMGNDPRTMDCNGTLPFWVDNGKTPPPGTPNVITVEMLSRLAYANTRVPGVTVVTSPAQTQTVNLPTWVRLTQNYSTVRVRAYVDLGGGAQLWAETKAVPQPVEIDPGESDATRYPASGLCPVSADGSVGKAYSGNPQATPPCGMTYRRSTVGSAPYPLRVTVHWKVSWTGSGGAGGGLPDGVVTNDPVPQVTVREIQAVNR